MDHERTHVALKSVGYLTTTNVSTIIYKAARLNRPILLEGPAGAGKTELALSVAKAENMRFVRLQCYQGITDKQAIGDYNRALQDLYVLLQSKSNTQDWKTIRKEILSREFYSAGPLLDALESEERCVLLIDELDKVDHAFEAMLLEILSVWEMSIPGMGTIRAKRPPFTVVTSNAERDLGFPLRRRCFYMQIEHPTPQIEASIVARKTPRCSQELHYFIAGFGEALRGYKLEKAPSISEISDLALALDLMGRTEMRLEDQGILLPLIAKTKKDLNKIQGRDGFQQLIAQAKKNADRLRAENVSEARSEGDTTKPSLVAA